MNEESDVLESMDLRSLRLDLNLRQVDVAEQAGLPISKLSRWERGLIMPPSAALHRLAGLYEVSVDVLEAAQEGFVSRATPGEGYTTRVGTEEGVFERSTQPRPGLKRVLDLFCGSGGFSYGFELTGGFEVTAGIDLLADRIDTFRANHAAAVSVLGDIRSFPIPTLGDYGLNPDVIIGGPPCQGFSSIRPFRELTAQDPRNSLFEQFAVAVAELRPRWFIFENVVGLLTHEKGRTLPALLTAFEAGGFRCDWRVINAANFGLPQNRERLIIVGSREGRAFVWPEATHLTRHRSMAGSSAKRLHVDPLFHQNLPEAVTVMEAIHDLPEISAGEEATDYAPNVRLSAYEKRMRKGSDRLTLHEATNHSERMLEIIRHAGANRDALPDGLTTSGFSSCYSRLDPDQPAVTLTVNFVHPASNKCIHPFQDRALTPREGARLQGFPDRFEFEGTRTSIVKQIGNAVPPLLGETLAAAISDQW